MIEWLFYLLPGVCVAIIIILIVVFRKQKNCPKCGNLLPKFRIPKTSTEKYGGWTCSKCGCEIDRNGNEITNAEEYRKKIKSHNMKWILYSVIGLIIVALIIYFVADYLFSPYKYSNNPQVCEKFGFGNYLRDNCYYEMAIKTDDINLCSNLGWSISLEEPCYSYFINKFWNESTCYMITSKTQQSVCFSKLAIKYNDSSMCLKINLTDAGLSAETNKELCLNLFK